MRAVLRQPGGTAYKQMYSTSRWQRVRRRQLEKEPLCAYCLRQGYTVAANVCDHVKGHPSGETEEQFWEGPFQSLCKACHNGAKQVLERRGRLAGGDEYGWPIDPDHEWNRKSTTHP